MTTYQTLAISDKNVLTRPATDVRVIGDVIRLGATPAYADDDVFELFEIPAGYAVLGGFVKWDDLSSAGTSTINLGTEDVEDAFVTGINVATAGFANFDLATQGGHDIDFSAATKVQLQILSYAGVTQVAGDIAVMALIAKVPEFTTASE